MVNAATIEQLINDVGPEPARRLVVLFVADSKASLAQMQDIAAIAGVRDIDWDTLTRLAHSMKSAMHTYGLDVLGDEAVILEKAGADKNRRRYQQVLSRIATLADAHFGALLAEIETQNRLK